MSAHSQINHESRGLLWYRRLIALYPGAFRDRYADEMLQVFEEEWDRVHTKGVFARFRYGAYVIGDLTGSMSSEWLKALPTETKIALIGMGAMVTLDAIGHQFLTLAYWLLLYTYLIAFLAIVRHPARFQFLSLLLLTGALGLANFVTVKWLAGIVGHSDYDNGFASASSGLFGVVFAIAAFGCDKLPPTTTPQRPFGRRHPMRFVFAVISISFGLALLMHFGLGDGRHGWTLAGLSLFFSKQFSAIRKLPGCGPNPEAKTEPASQIPSPS
jgi:hypothetical protein